MPLIGGKAYVDFIKFPYYRLPAFEKIENRDIVVFNFPEGDTVLLDKQDRSYYQEVKDYYFAVASNHDDFETIRKKFLKNNKYVVRPLDKMDNYIKRCVGIAGDSLEVRNSIVYINGAPLPEPAHMAHGYIVQFDPSFFTAKRTSDYIIVGLTGLGKKQFESAGISIDPTNTQAYKLDSNNNLLIKICATADGLKKLNAAGFLPNAKRELEAAGEWDRRSFPRSELHKWNKDNFGPLWIPKAGATITLTKENYPLYERAIRVYEHNNDFTINGDKFILNGQEVTTYTFKQDYYFMMGDNRDNSLDSRFWGFVPHDHVVGKPVFIWLSLDSDQTGLNKIRWNRLFKTVNLD
jgi:signal peptidase I